VNSLGDSGILLIADRPAFGDDLAVAVRELGLDLTVTPFAPDRIEELIASHAYKAVFVRPDWASKDSVKRLVSSSGFGRLPRVLVLDATDPEHYAQSELLQPAAFLFTPVTALSLRAAVDTAIRLCALHGAGQPKHAAKSLMRRFSAIFNMAPELITVSTLDEGRYLEVNDAFVDISGYARDEVIGKTSLELGIWPSLRERETILKEIREQGAINNREMLFRDRNGGLRDTLLSMAPVEIDGVQCLVSVVNDITERKKIQDEIASLERR